MSKFTAEEIAEREALRNYRPWISVTERMPEKNQFILAFGPGIGQSVDSPNIDVCLWDGYDLWDEGGTELTSETDFTHWQPIYLPNGARL